MYYCKNIYIAILNFMGKILKWTFIPLLLMALIIFSVNLISKNKIKSREQTAKKICGNCHLFPEPSLLSTHTWEKSVLPEMGHRLGYGDRNELLNRMSFNQFQALCNIGIYPEKSMVSSNDWEKIVSYYLENSSTQKTDRLSNPTFKSFKNPFDIFFPIHKTKNNTQTTSVRFIPAKKEIWIGKYNGQLEILNLKLKLKETLKSPGPVVDSKGDYKPIFLSIGTMTPTEEKNGYLYRYNPQDKINSLITNYLHRPVSLEVIDINQDDYEDYIILEFGFETGQLSWINGKTNKKKVLSNLPGARNIIPQDINKDGKMDFYALFAQGNEQIILFINKGNGNFLPKSILKLPPVFGSSYFEMSDLNNDGKKDIVLTNGDNADYSNEEKKYHGIHIFLNKGKQIFEESKFIFYPGATKTIVKDFDLDGNLDFATIAFFSQKTAPSFLYFKNEGNGNYVASSLNLPHGQWMTLEADDMDLDGDIDIILGNFNFSNTKEMPYKGSFLLLKNRII
ncbi:MAG: hypothetical protein RLZZ417_3243 [Bacteroidota bacterium]